MKKKLAILTAVTFSISSYAATSGNITLSGTVQANTAITVTNVSGFDALDLIAGGTDVSVASIREKNNTRTGYTVTLTSTNAGKLKYIVSGNTLAQVNYTAKYDGSAVTLSSGGSTITSVSSQASTVNTVKNFTVSFAGDPTEALLAGTYSDTLTFQIAAN